MTYARTTYGGQLPKNSGENSGATIVFSPMLQEVVGNVDVKDYEGNIE